MQRISLQFVTVMVVISAFLGPRTRATAQQDDKKAVENVVRSFDQALQDYDFVKVNSLFTPDARWIEESYPRSIPDMNKFFERAKAAKVRIAYHFRELEVRVEGNAAWVIDTLEGTFQADTEAGRALNRGESERHLVFVESVILVKTPEGWKIVLGQTTHIPESKPN